MLLYTLVVEPRVLAGLPRSARLTPRCSGSVASCRPASAGGPAPLVPLTPGLRPQGTKRPRKTSTERPNRPAVETANAAGHRSRGRSVTTAAPTMIGNALIEYRSNELMLSLDNATSTTAIA